MKSGKIFRNSKITFYTDLTGRKKSPSLHDGFNYSGWNTAYNLFNCLLARGLHPDEADEIMVDLQEKGYALPEDIRDEDSIWINTKMLPKKLQFSKDFEAIKEYLEIEM